MNGADPEVIEQTVMEMVVQALTDYREQAVTIFRDETDLPQDIAEDVTREAMDAMGVSSIGERLYGKIDYKRAICAFLPDATPVALMLDAKAEKQNGDRTATIQMSQTSMSVRMVRKMRRQTKPDDWSVTFNAAASSSMWQPSSKNSHTRNDRTHFFCAKSSSPAFPTENSKIAATRQQETRYGLPDAMRRRSGRTFGSG